MAGRFENKVVIVTGGAQGIGRGCAEVFCQEGANVGIIDRNLTTGTATASELTKAGPGTARCWECDVRNAAALRETIQDIAGKWGRVDCLVNNAGWHPPAITLDDTSLELLEDQVRLNFISSFVAAQAAVPHLRATQGTIISISSMTAVLGQDLAAAYSATKAAQIGMTKALAIELGRDGIRVNAILPSNIETPLMHQWASSFDQPQAAIQRMADLQVFRRLGTSQEIGRVALFLATADSSFMTGQALEVEGGASLDY